MTNTCLTIVHQLNVNCNKCLKQITKINENHILVLRKVGIHLGNEK